MIERKKIKETFSSIEKTMEIKGFRFSGLAHTHETSFNKEQKTVIKDQQVRTTDDIIENYKNRPEFNKLEKDKIVVELVKKEDSVGSYFVFVKILS